MTTETDGGRVMRMISELPPESQRRVFVTAQILRDLLERDDEHRESELAFTLVMCELADEPFASETPVRRAHSKSEYRRLTTQGVECLPPEIECQHEWIPLPGTGTEKCTKCPTYRHPAKTEGKS